MSNWPTDLTKLVDCAVTTTLETQLIILQLLWYAHPSMPWPILSISPLGLLTPTTLFNSHDHSSDAPLGLLPPRSY